MEINTYKVLYQDKEFLINAEEIEICSDSSIFYINGELVAAFPISAGVIKM